MNAIALVSLAAALSSAVAAPPANFSGSWTLDQARSTGLPPYYARVKSHALAVTQSDSELRVKVTVDVGGPSPDQISFAYALNGVETTTETAIRGPGGMVNVPTKLTASVTDGGGLHITITRSIGIGGPTIEAITTEDWSLSSDGRTLTVHRVDDTPRGKVDAQMVFVRS